MVRKTNNHQHVIVIVLCQSGVKITKDTQKLHNLFDVAQLSKENPDFGFTVQSEIDHSSLIKFKMAIFRALVTW